MSVSCTETLHRIEKRTNLILPVSGDNSLFSQFGVVFNVERFAVQVGNDTNDFRRSRYKEMSCKIAPDWACLRIL